MYATAELAPSSGDQFSKRIDAKPLRGRNFKVTVPYDEHGGSLSYSYDTETEVLTVRASLDSNILRARWSGEQASYLIIKQDSQYGSPQPMSNAFGATKEVTPVTKFTVGVGNLDERDVGVFPKPKKRDYSGRYLPLEKQISIGPDQGRAAVVGLAMEIEGIVDDGKESPVHCTRHHESAKIDYTYEVKWDECVVLAKLTRVALHSPKLGQIAEWKAPTNTGRKKK